jgi:predicted nucleic acid-binding protein
MAVRKGRVDPDFRRAALADLALLDITIDQQTDSYAWTDTLNLANRFQLTVYDAAYLELAQRKVLSLATLDGDLRNAAMAIGVEVLGAELK